MHREKITIRICTSSLVCCVDCEMAAGIVRVPGTAFRPGRVHFLRRAISLGKSVRVYRLKMQICSVAKNRRSRPHLPLFRRRIAIRINGDRGA
jgi:hypothetical protein